jgi:hypothetical protein
LSTQDPVATPDDDEAGDARAHANLSSDVAAWSADRSGRAGDARQQAEDVLKVAAPVKKRAVRKPAAAAPAAPQPAEKKKPFSMGYGGTSTQDYIAGLSARGRR